jgi:hypothetical protein
VAVGGLEPPPGEDSLWDELYVAREGEVPVHRPLLTGDVFTRVQIRKTTGEVQTKSVMILQHPCTMRTTGAALKDSLLVASLRNFPVLGRGQWSTNEKCMPLPDLRPGIDSGARNQGAFFESAYFVHPDDLLAGTRIACLSEIGMYLALQRWMYHSSRLAVPTWQLEEANSHVYAEADLGEAWGEVAVGCGVSLDASVADFDAWLGAAPNGTSRRDMLRSTGQRSQVQRDMKQELKARYQPQATEVSPAQANNSQPGPADIGSPQAHGERT